MAKWPLGEADRGICRSATWIARRRNERGIYRETKLGLADDLQDANGDTVLDFAQAQRNARTWWTHEQRLASGLGCAVAAPYTACASSARAPLHKTSVNGSAKV